MKRLFFFMMVMGLTAVLFAQTTNLPEYRFAAGTWAFNGPRLVQNDIKNRLAKVNFQVPQKGPMIYDFNARYEDGAEDGQGGFGIHIFMDSPYNGASWGAGRSYLLWLNYDEAPITKGIPTGFSAQVYKSRSNSQMDLVESVSLNEYLPFLTDENLAQPVPFRIWADGDTGEIRVYDPTDPDLNTYYYFNIDSRELPLKGDWVALRTNGLKLSFALGL
jgi:hypothetical protein